MQKYRHQINAKNSEEIKFINEIPHYNFIVIGVRYNDIEWESNFFDFTHIKKWTKHFKFDQWYHDLFDTLVKQLEEKIQDGKVEFGDFIKFGIKHAKKLIEIQFHPRSFILREWNNSEIIVHRELKNGNLKNP